MRRAHRFDNALTLGGRIPAAVGLVLALTVVASIGARLAENAGVPVFRNVALVPGRIWMGQVWRLATWVLFEENPLNLIFAALMLYWFGRDLSFAWGPRRFVYTYFGFAVAAGLVTSGIARFWVPLQLAGFLGPWPVIDGLVVAWALFFSDRQITFWFVLPMSGRTLLYVTVGGTIFFAIFQGGIGAFIPHFAAEALMLAYVRGLPFRQLRQRWRLWTFERRTRRRNARLKVVKRGDGAPPTWLN